jgi:uncharacterized protein YbgA (DUF1722 family)/uncharacterized protein YbbK (DUF523 family)
MDAGTKAQSKKKTLRESPENETGAKIPVAISSCLLGDEVRFDGGHKKDSYITGTLDEYFEFVPICPEVEIGLTVPREPIRLVGKPDNPRAVGIRTEGLDVTDKLHDYGVTMARKLDHVCGYIFKRASPSCGMERVRVYSEKGMPNKTGVGIYARAFMAQQPLIPCEEEGRLGDPVLRENFIQRVFVLYKWKQMSAGRLSAAKIVDFHTRHKFIIMAHNQAAYRRLGKMVATVGTTPIREFANRYIADVMAALKTRATRRSHVNVLQHLMGFLKNNLDAEDKEEMLDTISSYHRGEVPLIVPITLMKHHFRRHPDPYIQQQYYLSPHPRELMLRNLI